MIQISFHSLYLLCKYRNNFIKVYTIFYKVYTAICVLNSLRIEYSRNSVHRPVNFAFSIAQTPRGFPSPFCFFVFSATAASAAPYFFLKSAVGACLQQRIAKHKLAASRTNRVIISISINYKSRFAYLYDKNNTFNTTKIIHFVLFVRQK